MLLGQGFDGFLLRKTCGAGRSSNEAGCRFVYDLSARCFDAVPHGKAGYVVAFAENGDLLTLEHVSFPKSLLFASRVVFEHKRHSIVELGQAIQKETRFGQNHRSLHAAAAHRLERVADIGNP
jgi:hypothetical protein